MPLAQGVVLNLALVGWQHWNRNARLHGDSIGVRVRRWWYEGHFLDVGVLEQLLRANVGDLTFEEAYTRTKRVLNITVTTSGGGGVPNLLNYLTAPNVVSIVSSLHELATDKPSSFGPPPSLRMQPRPPRSITLSF